MHEVIVREFFWRSGSILWIENTFFQPLDIDRSVFFKIILSSIVLHFLWKKFRIDNLNCLLMYNTVPNIRLFFFILKILHLNRKLLMWKLSINRNKKKNVYIMFCSDNKSLKNFWFLSIKYAVNKKNRQKIKLKKKIHLQNCRI